MKKFNNYIYWGVFLNGIWLLSIRFNLLPDFIEGFCIGLGLVLVFVGMYSEKHDISRLKNYKKTLFNRVISK